MSHPEDREKAIGLVERKLLTALHLVGITPAIVPSLAYEIVEALVALSPAEPTQGKKCDTEGPSLVARCQLERGHRGGHQGDRQRWTTETPQAWWRSTGGKRQ